MSPPASLRLFPQDAHQAFANGVLEVFAVVRLGNTRGVATARRIGMEWVGETDKYYGLTLQIYRLTAPDLDYPEPGAGVRRYGPAPHPAPLSPRAAVGENPHVYETDDR